MTFEIPGQPIPKGRPRIGRGGHVFTPKRTVQFEDRVRLFATIARVQPMTGPLQVETVFYLKDLRKMDGDNLQKAILDALNGIAYVDDSSVMSGKWSKHLDKLNPRTVVTVEGLPEAPMYMLGGVEMSMLPKLKTQEWGRKPGVLTAEGLLASYKYLAENPEALEAYVPSTNALAHRIAKQPKPKRKAEK